MEFNEVRDAVYKTAHEKGFWDTCNTTVAQMKTDKQAHDAKQAFLSQKLMLTVSELGEALEALRSDRFADIVEFQRAIKEREEHYGHELSEMQWRESFEAFIKNTFEDELADAIIRILDICGKLGIDIDWHLQQKMQYNGQRPYMHGRNF